jgi:dTDP-4-dehydrorhamnose reductase
MKILILGGSGMLGHQLWRDFHERHEVWVTLRRSEQDYHRYNLFRDGRVFADVDAMDFERVELVIRNLRPDAVLNCVGIIKQLKEAGNPIKSIAINSLFPHRLANICGELGSRLLLFSTDCVFSGNRGSYTEADFSDAEDLYGRTKFLGEVNGVANAITLRSSIIGRELASKHSLVDWFLSQNGGNVFGFRRAIYTGFTTIEMSRIVERILTIHRNLSGLWQVASAPINKYELLLLIRENFQIQVDIEPSDELISDRSLIGKRFTDATGYFAPSWPTMVAELATRSRGE